MNTRIAIQFTRDDLKRKTTILRKINPSDCSFKPIGNQNLILHWGLFAENLPEQIFRTDDPEIDIRRSHLYYEDISYNRRRMGLGRKPFHLVDFHDVPDGMFHEHFLQIRGGGFKILVQKVFEGDLSCDGKYKKLKVYCIFDQL